MKKKVKYLLIISFLFLGFIPKVLADDNIIDFTKKGEINITFKELQTNDLLPDIEIKLYQVATISLNNNNIDYKLSKGFTNCHNNFDLTSENLISNLKTCMIESDTINYLQTTNKDGKVTFDNLELGLYMAVQNNKIEGYSTFSSFLIKIPETIDNKWIYKIEAKPKTDIFKTMELKVQKMWFNMYYDIPDKITVALMKDEEIIQTAELGNFNDWTYTFKDIPKYDSYIVKELDVPKGFKVVYRDYSNVYLIVNIDYLAQTGQNIILIIIFGFLGLILITLGLILTKRKKYE